MQVHDLPLSVALNPDIGFLKVLVTYHPFSEAGFDRLEGTRKQRYLRSGLSARAYRRMEQTQLPDRS
jgi:hypothetical protein